MDESTRLKLSGKEFAAAIKPRELDIARALARSIALRSPNKTCHMDEIREMLDLLDISLGPAAGSVFNTVDWEDTGVRVKSTLAQNHARELTLWRLVECS